MTIDNIKEAINVLFNFPIVDETNEKVVFNVISDKTAILDKAQVANIILQLDTFQSYQDVELFDNTQYEVLVRNETRIFFSRDIEQKDTVNKLIYKIDKPTTNYLLFFLFNLNKQNTPRILRNGIMPHRLKRLFEPTNQPQLFELELNVLDVIKEIVPRLETLQIKSETIKKKADYEQLVYSFLFNLGYNTDHIILPLRFMDEFTQPYKIGRLRRANISEIEPPKRTYVNELILHYQKGLSSESIDHQFLSFYHVLEYYFEKIYNDDIVANIKDELTRPNFSYKRNKDITNLISIIHKRLRYKDDEFLVNEPEALELTLKKFITDTNFLKSELQSIAPTLVEYFKTTDVPFSNGNKVNFETGNSDEILKNLSKRIYSTRNSIVHSKETNKSKYTPFKDDKDLINEIYLMRVIAEIVIIANSKEL